MTPKEIEVMARHLGHDAKTHKEYYRLSDSTIELTKVIKSTTYHTPTPTSDSLGLFTTYLLCLYGVSCYVWFKFNLVCIVVITNDKLSRQEIYGISVKSITLYKFDLPKTDMLQWLVVMCVWLISTLLKYLML